MLLCKKKPLDNLEKVKKELRYLIKVAVGYRSVTQFISTMPLVDAELIIKLSKGDYNEFNLPDRNLLRLIATNSEGRITHTLLYSLFNYSERDEEEDRSWTKIRVKRSQVYTVDFGYNMDSEQSGKRPAIIIQNDKGNNFSTTTVVIPLSSKCKFSSKMHVLLEKELGLKQISYAFPEQIKVISLRRIIPYVITTLPESKMSLIENSLKLQLGIDPLMFDEGYAFTLAERIKILQRNITIKKSKDLISILNDKIQELANYCSKYSKDYSFVMKEYERLCSNRVYA